LSILIKYVRIYGFRGLENIEVKLNQHTTVLTGMNNTGKTSFLKALQIVFGNTQFISQDDFFVSGNRNSDKIIVDILIVPKDNGVPKDGFDKDYEALFGEARIKYDKNNKQCVPLRTVVTFDPEKKSYKTRRIILSEWQPFQSKTGSLWHQNNDGQDKYFNFYDQLPFFYMDAKRDILENIKNKKSYLGKMISKTEYSEEVIKTIEKQIESLNKEVISNSDILSAIKETLKGLNTAMGTSEQGVEIIPFTKKVRDINKGMSIYYTDKKDSFSMEYHGMGTRSWSSLLTLKAFISVLSKNPDQKKNIPFFPIIAIEEPEAHIHPNAQKKLYKQIEEMPGQKIISTHSPYIAASADLKEIRNFYYDENIRCGEINTNELTDEDIRKIKWKVINTRGEIFFSKALIFFEGETEEQVLPIFAKDYFKKHPFELGVNFIGVGGGGNYLPFLRFAEGLNIPWFILSDGEEKIVEKINKDIKALKNSETDINKQDNIIILDKGYDFEKYLIENGYIGEIEKAVNQLHNNSDYIKNYIDKKNRTLKGRQKTEKKCKECKQYIYEDNMRDYEGEDGFKTALYDCITEEKTQIAPIIAEKIVESKKELPPEIKQLFERIERSFFNNKVK